MHGLNLAPKPESHSGQSAQERRNRQVPAPHIALLPWGHTIEEFLDTVGLSIDQFGEEMTGGWLFGYVQALQLAGFRVTIVCFSRKRKGVVSMRHLATGADICLLPASRIYCWLRRFFVDPYAWSTREMFAGKRLPRRVKRFLRDLLPYCATPLLVLWRELRRSGANILLCQEYESARFDAATLLGGLLRVPVFATFQGGNWQTSQFEEKIRPRTMRRCSGLIIGPDEEAARVQATYEITSQKLARIPNPIDLAEWKAIDQAQARTGAQLPLDARVAICHGRIDIFRKGLDVLLDAWRMVRAAHPNDDWRLVLIGSGESASQFRAMLEARNDRSIMWLDHYMRDRSVMRMWLSAADVYVMASRHEGFPLAPIEAMACGLPVIATAVPGIAEIMGDKVHQPGIIVPIADAPALARGLEELLGDRSASTRLGVSAKKRAKEFSMKTVSGQLRLFLLSHTDSSF